MLTFLKTHHIALGAGLTFLSTCACLSYFSFPLAQSCPLPVGRPCGSFFFFFHDCIWLHQVLVVTHLGSSIIENEDPFLSCNMNLLLIACGISLRQESNLGPHVGSDQSYAGVISLMKTAPRHTCPPLLNLAFSCCLSFIQSLTQRVSAYPSELQKLTMPFPRFGR